MRLDRQEISDRKSRGLKDQNTYLWILFLVESDKGEPRSRFKHSNVEFNRFEVLLSAAEPWASSVAAGLFDGLLVGG